MAWWRLRGRRLDHSTASNRRGTAEKSLLVAWCARRAVVARRRGASSGVAPPLLREPRWRVTVERDLLGECVRGARRAELRRHGPGERVAREVERAQPRLRRRRAMARVVIASTGRGPRVELLFTTRNATPPPYATTPARASSPSGRARTRTRGSACSKPHRFHILDSKHKTHRALLTFLSVTGCPSAGCPV